ncbi:MAG TPA: acyl-ACP desaturase [Gammaproteobacteria bacterium]|nr:acyl-ACP desaturase [Gammaproteobacteria bacterium]
MVNETIPSHTPDLVLSGQHAVLSQLEDTVASLMQRHKRKRRLWYPAELVPAHQKMTDDQLRTLHHLPDRAAALPDAVRVSLALNLLTEEGLPHFHRLISIYLGPDSIWSQWNAMWTAEEDRHGNVIHDYVRTARLYDAVELDKMQYLYIEAGFNPDWENNPYRLLAYTSIQERATQIAHANTGRIAGHYEPLIQTILDKVSSDEARHYAFYRGVFQAIIKADPDRALEAALSVISAFNMPGHTIPGYDDMAAVVYRSGIYGPREYKAIIEELLDFWGIATLTGLSSHGRKAQDSLMRYPDRLERVSRYMERRTRTKTYTFPFIYNRAIRPD